MRIILIRHGKTAGNLEKRYIGRTDESLCSEGLRDLEDVSKKIAAFKIDTIFSSPMKRCLETASILFPRQVSEIKIIDDFRETDFGLFEGKNYEELKNNPEYIKWLESNGALGFPGGEDRETAGLRAREGFASMIKQCFCENLESGNNFFTAAAVVHGGTIMAILSEYCGGDFYDYQIGNGEGYIFNLNKESNKIKINDLRKI